MSTINDDFDRPFENVEPLQWSALREVCNANIDYFTSHQDENGVRIKAALLAILDHLDQAQPLYRDITKFAPHFDFDKETPGNGYRSFLLLMDRCVMHSVQICREMYNQKDSMMFRKSHHMKEVEACSHLMAALCTCLQHLITLHSWSTQAEVMSDGKLSLFSLDSYSAQELLNRSADINSYCFYGRCLGFQFCNSVKRVIKTLSFAMASFSEMYYNNGNIFERCAKSVNYLMDPEARARRIVNVSQHADISFCQTFWFLNESQIMTMMNPLVTINQVLSIPPEELTLPTLNGGSVSIPIPTSHIGKKPIHVRLLSSKRRLGMAGVGNVGGELFGLCDELIFHVHGGGFVSQTSRSHEIYLRDWAVKLGVSILSVDYSLAPEAPFPRALEEVVYTYAWALKHASTLLGSNAKKVIFVGDSAGGNLCFGAILKCIQLNIRKPDGIFGLYTPILIEFVPSPSRLLCLTDPMLPFGFMMRCLKAYAATDNKKPTKEQENIEKSDTESFAEVSESDLIALALSPNGEGANGTQKLVSLPSDSTLNSVSLTEVDGAECPKEQAKSKEYFSRFLNMYRNSGFGTSSSHVAQNGSGSRDDNISEQSNKSWSLFGWSLSRKNSIRELDLENAKSPSEEFAFTVPKDPFLSPYLAPDNVLAHMPPTKLLTVHLDPCLDDSIMFARKLRSIGNKVTLDILSELPHGFLNLIQTSKEAQEGEEIVVGKLKELLEL